MLHIYAARNGTLEHLQTTLPDPLPADCAWIDLVDPSQDEEHAVETWLGIEIPTREDMQEIEASSRLYVENDALYMTAVIVSGTDTSHPATTPITFVVTRHHLVTVRYCAPRPFLTFIARCERQPQWVARGDGAFVGLLEAVVDRAADLLERVGSDLDGLSFAIFAENGAPAGRKPVRRGLWSRPAPPADLQLVLKDLGRHADLASKLRESLWSIVRVAIFFRNNAEEWLPPDVATRLRTLVADARSLTDHDAYLSSKINLLLDATLGLINIQQNAIIKIFSVAAVVFMPPTLIASIYGMNFHFIPELDWPLGYLWALSLMVLSAIVPYLYFKFRRWL